MSENETIRLHRFTHCLYYSLKSNKRSCVMEGWEAIFNEDDFG